MRSTPGNKGSTTILIILIAGVIITVGLGFNWLVKEHIKSSEGLKNKAEAILKARSAYDTLIYLILNGKVTQKEVLFSGVQNMTTLKSIPLNGREVLLADDCYVRVQESNGLLSLALIDSVTLERLIRNVGHVENAAIPVESLLDWIDTDDLSRVNGAESAHYRNQQMTYHPRNYALQYKEEIAFVRGIGSDVYMKIEPYLTIMPSTGFNPNTAGDTVLKAYLDINDDSLAILKDYVAKIPLISDRELFSLAGRRLRSRGEDINYYPSRFMEIQIRVGSHRSLYTIKAGLHFDINSASPYSILYWREE